MGPCPRCALSQMFFRGWLDPRTAEKVTFIHLEEVDEWLPKDSMAV